MNKSFNALNSKTSYVLVLLWVLNDLFLKQKFGNFITGKLSDVCGLVVFPLLLTFFLSVIFKNFKEKVLLIFSIVLSYSVFLIININQNWSNFYYGLIGSKVNGISDLTDLLCIPLSLFILIYIYKKTKPNISKDIKSYFIIPLSTFAFIATSYARPRFSDIKIVHPLDLAEIKNELTVFVWYTVECKYEKFYFHIRRIDEDELPENEKITLEEYKLKNKDFSTQTRIELTKKDIFETYDEKFRKNRYEFGLNLNYKPGEYEWCISSEQKYESYCKISLDLRESNPQYGFERNERFYNSCKKL
ncbi:MAG: hypothetical protein KDK36_15060, partial [Leptospiraceae bacterium]|nr:hypothetical protein [Leptospiraceae bacterium]